MAAGKKTQEPEYAPQYPMRERVKYAVLGVGFAAVVIGTFEVWLFPLWSAFVKTAHCRTVLGIAGTAVVMYVTFVGIPLGAAITSGAFIVPLALRSIRARHYPPPGQKVLGKVRIQTGRRAVLSAATNLALVGALVALGVWGSFQARKILEDAKPPDRRSCVQLGYNEPMD